MKKEQPLKKGKTTSTMTKEELELERNKDTIREQDIVYERIGLDTIVEEPDLVQVHEDRNVEVLAEELTEDQTGTSLKHVTENKLANGERFEITAKTAFQESKVALGRLPIWYLNALGSMTENELKDFEKEYAKELSLNEIVALNLLKKARWGDKEATDKFWNIQMKLLNKTNVQNQINVSIQKPDSVVTDLLDNITKKIKEADVN